MLQVCASFATRAASLAVAMLQAATLAPQVSSTSQGNATFALKTASNALIRQPVHIAMKDLW